MLFINSISLLVTKVYFLAHYILKQIETNDRVRIGNFLLGKELKVKFEEFTQFTSDERPTDPEIKMHAGLYFHAKDVWEPDIGDIRVQFSYAGREGDQVLQHIYEILTLI